MCQALNPSSSTDSLHDQEENQNKLNLKSFTITKTEFTMWSSQRYAISVHVCSIPCHFTKEFKHYSFTEVQLILWFMDLYVIEVIVVELSVMCYLFEVTEVVYRKKKKEIIKK